MDLIVASNMWKNLLVIFVHAYLIEENEQMILTIVFWKRAWTMWFQDRLRHSRSLHCTFIMVRNSYPLTP